MKLIEYVAGSDNLEEAKVWRRFDMFQYNEKYASTKKHMHKDKDRSVYLFQRKSMNEDMIYFVNKLYEKYYSVPEWEQVLIHCDESGPITKYMLKPGIYPGFWDSMCSDLVISSTTPYEDRNFPFKELDFLQDNFEFNTEAWKYEENLRDDADLEHNPQVYPQLHYVSNKTGNSIYVLDLNQCPRYKDSDLLDYAVVTRYITSEGIKYRLVYIDKSSFYYHNLVHEAFDYAIKHLKMNEDRLRPLCKNKNTWVVFEDFEPYHGIFIQTIDMNKVPEQEKEIIYKHILNREREPQMFETYIECDREVVFCKGSDTLSKSRDTHMDCRRLSEPWLPFPTMWASSLVQRTESIHRGV